MGSGARIQAKLGVGRVVMVEIVRAVRAYAGGLGSSPGMVCVLRTAGLIGVAALGTPAHQRLVLRDTVPHDHQGWWSNFAA
jgi:hypothetical protein